MIAATALTVVAGPVVGQADGDGAEVGPLVTDRPDFTESAATVAPGLFQLEAGYSFSRTESERQHDVGELLLRIGVHDAVELRLGGGSFSVLEPGDRATGTVEGLQDASLGLKVGLLRPGAAGVPRTALLVATTLPTGADGLGASGLQPGATLAMGWELPDGLGLGVNVGYESVEEDGRDLGRAKASVALGVPVAGPVGAFVEGFVLVPEGSRPERPFVDGGLTWLLDPDLQLDVRAGAGLGPAEPDLFAGAGLSVRF